jgi:phage tail-like protein
MADDGSKQSASTWPLATFQFLVKIGIGEFLFQEVSGLASESQIIEYRGGNSKVYSTVKMPGIQKYGNITLKKGKCKHEKSFEKIYNAIMNNTFSRTSIIISLLMSLMQWPCHGIYAMHSLVK